MAPADHHQARSALLATWDFPRLVYYRLSKDYAAIVEGLEGRFELGRLVVLREGANLLLVTMGPVAGDVVAAADDLAAQGVWMHRGAGL